jgi:hypothetical protein
VGDDDTTLQSMRNNNKTRMRICLSRFISRRLCFAGCLENSELLLLLQAGDLELLEADDIESDRLGEWAVVHKQERRRKLEACKS